MLIICLDTICENDNALTYEDIKNLDIDNNKIYLINDTSFFDFEYMEKFGDVILFKRKTNEYISAKELLDNDGSYTEREIRLAHNIQKLFRSGAFKFKKYFSINKKDNEVMKNYNTTNYNKLIDNIKNIIEE